MTLCLFLFQKKNTKPNVQITMLFDALRVHGLTEFINFLEVLGDTSHGWLADDIYETIVNASNIDQSGAATKVSLKEFINSLEENIEKHHEDHARQYAYPAGYYAYPGIPIAYAFPGSLFARHHGLGDGEAFSDPVSTYMHENHRSRRLPLGNTEIISRRTYPPSVENASKQLRSLEEVYERESLSADTTMTLLKQEEIAIRKLLENNVQEQQILLSKKEAITDLGERMKEINVRASRLHTVETDKLSRARLRHLQRVPFRYTHAYTNNRNEDDAEKR